MLQYWKSGKQRLASWTWTHPKPYKSRPWAPHITK